MNSKDILNAGYLIPKGWKVMPLFRNIHHNSEFFADPQNFDASRFEVCGDRVLTKCFSILHLSRILKYEKLVNSKKNNQVVDDGCRLLPNPIPTCHLATVPMLVLEMNSPNWRC